MISEQLRNCGVGGTDIAAILGVDNYRDAFSVWAEKTGRLERLPATPRMRLGKYFEKGIIAYYSELTGRETEFIDETRRDPNRPFMVWTPDAICRNEPRGIDAKLVAWDQRHLWGDTSNDIPARVQCQCHWYMAAEKYEVWDVIALLGSDQPHIYTIERDLEIEREMLERAEEFWKRYIIGDEQPPIGDSEGSTRYLRERFPRNLFEVREAEPAEIETLEQYAQARAERDCAQGDITLFENQIKLAIGNADGLVWPNGKFTWKRTKDSTRVDWESLAGSLMASLNDSERAAHKAAFSEVRPGIRRIYFQCRGTTPHGNDY
jgi:predicted phage-related endonuclease